MATVRLVECTPTMFAKLRRHLHQVQDVTPGRRLVDAASGELRAFPVYSVLVPSHDSHPGHRWELRVSWHPHKVNAWHVAQVDDDGNPLSCLAYVTAGRCWHLYAAALYLAEVYDRNLPEPARAPAPATSPAGVGARRPRHRRPATASPEPFVPWPPLATAGWYD
jgi:hypothetical protein